VESWRVQRAMSQHSHHKAMPNVNCAKRALLAMLEGKPRVKSAVSACLSIRQVNRDAKRVLPTRLATKLVPLSANHVHPVPTPNVCRSTVHRLVNRRVFGLMINVSQVNARFVSILREQIVCVGKHLSLESRLSRKFYFYFYTKNVLKLCDVAPFFSGDVVTCGCAIIGETNVVQMQAMTGLDEKLVKGGLLPNITFAVQPSINGRKREPLQTITNLV
jgi:hypothetical protein